MGNRYINYNDRKKKNAPKIKVLTKLMKKKLAGLFMLILVALALLGVVVLKNQTENGKKFEEIVLSHQNYSSRTIPYKRGDITDRNGNLLATSIKVYNVVLDAYIITQTDDGKYIEDTIKAVDECFEQVTADEVRALLNNNSESRYVLCDKLKKLRYEEIEKLEKILNDYENYPNVEGVWFEEEYKRMYPYSSLASSTIGFSSAGNTGVIGLESYYNDVLNGTDGRKYGYLNEKNTMEPIVKEAKDGNSLISSIDINLQTIAEKYIDKWVADYNPKIVAVMLANPNTGEIYAMADNNSMFDLNNPHDLTIRYTDEEIAAMTEEDKLNNLNKIWRNFCISDTYEAGSTIKPFTVAGALEDGKINTNLTFMCDGGEAYSSYIRCHKNSGHGVLNVEQALMNSCNDSLMQIAAIQGKESFCKYQSIFGFGSKSGVDLPGEASCEGLLFDVGVMGETDLATNSFGQNFNVTAVQMVAGFSSLINGGNYYKPHVIKQEINSKGGVVKNYDKELIKQTVTKETSDFIRQSMMNTVEGGTGKTAKVAGYKVGGKTGTAQHHDKTDNNYLLSFLGFAPYENPQVVCYAIVDSPDVPDKGSSSYACKLFSAVMTEVLPYMNVFPTEEVEDGSNTNTGQTSIPEENVNNEETSEEPSNTEEESTTPYEPSFDENIDPEHPLIEEEESSEEIVEE